KLRRVVCELRYGDAYLIYDRTGAIANDLHSRFSNFKVQQAQPNQSVFQADDGVFAFETNQCRVTADTPDNSLETFSKTCKIFFGRVADCLEISVFSRVGLRLICALLYKSEDEINAAISR